MNQASARTKRSRPYNNGLRRKQAEATGEIILDALEEQLSAAAGDISIARLAEAAGVSEATVFRHFATREALFEAFSRRAAKRFRLNDHIGETLGELASRVDPLFRYFEQSHQLIGAVVRAPGLRRYAERSRQRRSRRIEELVGQHAPALDDPRRRAVAGVIHLMMSADGWLWLVDRFGADPAHLRGAVAWVLELVARNLAEGHAPPHPTGDDT